MSFCGFHMVFLLACGAIPLSLYLIYLLPLCMVVVNRYLGSLKFCRVLFRVFTARHLKTTDLSGLTTW